MVTAKKQSLQLLLGTEFRFVLNFAATKIVQGNFQINKVEFWMHVGRKSS
jgi:hypothetical protein